MHVDVLVNFLRSFKGKALSSALLLLLLLRLCLTLFFSLQASSAAPRAVLSTCTSSLLLPELSLWRQHLFALGRSPPSVAPGYPWVLLLMLQLQQYLVRHDRFNTSNAFSRAASMMLTVARAAASLL